MGCHEKRILGSELENVYVQDFTKMFLTPQHEDKLFMYSECRQKERLEYREQKALQLERSGGNKTSYRKLLCDEDLVRLYDNTSMI